MERPGGNVRCGFLARILPLLASLAAASVAAGGEIQVRRVTHDLVADAYPQIAGTRLAWLRGGQVHLFENGTLLPLTEGVARYAVDVTHKLVAWRSCEVFDDVSCYEPSRLFVFDGKAVTPLTAPEVDVTAFDADGSKVAWVGSFDIFLYDGEETQQLTHYLAEGLPPAYDQIALSGSTVVWEAGGDVYRHHLGRVAPLTDESYPGEGRNLQDLDVSDGRVVWSDYVDDDREIFLFDGKDILQLTDDDAQQYFPRISGSRVVWQVIGLDGEDDVEIHLFDGEKSAALTDNDFHDKFPQISATHVVWVGEPAGINDPGEIYAYDGSSIRRVTENDYEDTIPSISGSRFVWHGCPDYEIKACTLPVRPYGTILAHAEIFQAPEPGVCLQALVAGACSAGLASRRLGREARRAARAGDSARG
jgi:hypothetical protein